MKIIIAFIFIGSFSGCTENTEKTPGPGLDSYVTSMLQREAQVILLDNVHLAIFPSGIYRRWDSDVAYQVQVSSDGMTIHNESFAKKDDLFAFTSLGTILLYKIDGHQYILCSYCYEIFLLEVPTVRIGAFLKIPGILVRRRT